jgi:hypothetical protein
MKSLNRRPNNNRNIITVVCVAVVFVVMNIVIIKVRNKRPKHSTYQRPSPLQFSSKRWLVDRGSGVHNARRRKLPRGP